ncbi:MAG: helix-turn-helix transcriptional regulator [Clostridia bacterium]|nr:helix-turn-helix transcriptional regulator [Clostridia bacterium]
MSVRKLNNKYSNIISEYVEKYRKQHGLSKSDLCRELSPLGINMYNNIYTIEHNKKNVKDFELYALAKALNVTLDDLLNKNRFKV